MRRIRNFTLWLLGLWIIASLVASGEMQPELGNPIAIDRISDTEFYVLSSDATVRRLRNTGSGFQQSSKFSTQGFPIDFTYSVSDGVASIFICSTLAGKGVVSRYSTNGALTNRWWLWHTCGGLDFDPEEHMLYMATTDTNEIYRLDVRKNGQPESIGELPGAGKIGAIAVDPARKLVYASDVSDGVVYEYNVAKRSSRAVATNLGSPVALYFDSENQLLYVADATAKRNLSVSLNRASQIRQSSKQTSKPAKPLPSKPNVRVLVQSSAFGSPSGVVRGADGDLVISDYGANRLFVVSVSGNMKLQYPR